MLPAFWSCNSSTDDNPKFTTLELIVNNSQGTGFAQPIDIKLYSSLEDWAIDKNPVYETILPAVPDVNELLWTAQIVDPGIYFVDAHSQETGDLLSNWESDLRINVFADQANSFVINVNVNESYLLSTQESSWQLVEYFVNGENRLDSCWTSDSISFEKGVRSGVQRYFPKNPICNNDSLPSSGSWVLNNETSTTLDFSAGSLGDIYDFSIGQQNLSLFKGDSSNYKSLKYQRVVR